jgi:phosphate transport system protein
LIILKKSFFVFSNQDLDKAKELPIDDDRIDEMYDSILNEVTENMIKNNELIPYFVDVIFLARYFERIADKSVSIGSRTIFMLTLRRPSIDD